MDVQEWFGILAEWSVIVYAASSMLAVGLAHPVARIVAPLRNWPRVVRALVANFLLVPVLAYLLARHAPLRMDVEQQIGLFLVGCGAGAPFLLFWADVSKADRAFAAALLVLLLPLTVVFLPAVVPRVLPRAEVDAWAIAGPLLLILLLPLAVGLALRPLLPRLARTVWPRLNVLSRVALVLLLISTVGANLNGLSEVFSVAAICNALILVFGAFVIGYTLGGRRRKNRSVVAFATAQRNIAAASAVAVETYGGGAILMMVVFISVLTLVALFPLAKLFRHRVRPEVGARRRVVHRPREV